MNAYYKLLKHPKWFEKRNIIIKRDGHVCKYCGSADGLIVHHRRYNFNKKTQRFELPWNYENKHLLTLCKNCHQKGHSIYKIPVKTIY